MRIPSLIPLAAASLSLSGCMVASAAKTAVDVVTLPVKVAGKAVDLATTSQAEADQKRGKALRKAEEKFGRDHKAWEKACAEARARAAELRRRTRARRS